MPITYSANLGMLDRLKNDAALYLRRGFFNRFMRVMRPTRDMRVADFGVSGHRDHPVHYFFESLYPWKDRLTAIGQAAEDASWFPEQFPGMQFVEADLRAIPLPDNYFDIGICNAVVEHAGPYDQQVKLVHEVCRVSKRVMFTTPNKSFPVELHTFLPFAHWLPDEQFHTILRTFGYQALATIDDLNPIDAPTLLSLFPPDRDTRMLPGGPLLLRTNLVCVSSSR
jgi:SAM-dependent methyltransferase